MGLLRLQHTTEDVYLLTFVVGIRLFQHCIENRNEVLHELFEALLIEEGHAVGESGFDTLLEGVHDVNLNRGCQEDEANIRFLRKIAEHVEYLIEEQLLGSLYVVIDVLENE